MATEIYYLVCLASFIILAYLDSKYFFISDLVLCVLVATFFCFCTFVSVDPSFIVLHLISALCIFCLFGFVYARCGGLGFGDVKYSCVLSLLFGFFRSLELFLFSTFTAIFYAFVFSIKDNENLQNKKIPYGTFLSMVAILFLFFFTDIPLVAQTKNDISTYSSQAEESLICAEPLVRAESLVLAEPLIRAEPLVRAESPLIHADWIQLDFVNQKNTDILKSLATFCDKTLNYDETVTGFSSFSFYDEDFESALSHFCHYNGLYWKNDGGIYFVSKIFVRKVSGNDERDEKKASNEEKKASNENDDVLFSVYAEDCNPASVIKELSRESGVSIMVDTFPSGTISLHIENATLEQVLNIFSLRYEGMDVNFEKGVYFLRNKSILTKKNDFRFNLKEKNGLFNLNVERSNISLVLSELFKKSGKEFAYFAKNDSVLENIKIEGKSFSEILEILMNLSSCVCVEKENIFFIFDSKQKEILSPFRDIYIVPLTYIRCSDVMSFFPQELNASIFVKQDRSKNRLFITGSPKEVQPIIDFIKKIDTKHEGLYYARFCSPDISKITSLIPSDMLLGDVIIVPGTKDFVTLVNEEKENELKKFLSLFSLNGKTHQVKLKYINADEAIKFLPSNIDTDCVKKTPDENTLLFLGTDEEYSDFLLYISIIDKCKNQIRYQLLVVQYQKSTNRNVGLDASLSGTIVPKKLVSSLISSDSGEGSSYTSGDATTSSEDVASSLICANIANLFSIDFDVVSSLGIQTAINLNSELAENRAKILADTTLNGISGNDIQFENKNIFRYRDIITDSSSSTTYSSVVKEISTGLVLKINGTVSGDELISVKVNANISKQGSSSSESSLPSTSEKNVSTFVQTQSAKPIIISALLQNEIDETKSKFPLFEKISWLEKLYGSKHSATALTEFVIYLTPFLEKDNLENLSVQENCRRLYEKYVAEK